MDYKGEQRLFGLCLKEHQSGGCTGVERFVHSFEGSLEERKYLERLRDYLVLRNSTGETRIHFLSSYNSLRKLITESHHSRINFGRN